MEMYDPHTNAWYIKLSCITAGMPLLSEARMGRRSWARSRGMTCTPMPDIYSYHVLLQVCLCYRRPGWVGDPEHDREVWPAHQCLIYIAIMYYCRYAFAIGGQDGSEILSTMERYDPHTNAWMLVAPLAKPLRFMTSTSHKGKLYVFGGESTNDVSSAAYRLVSFSPVSNIWCMYMYSKTCL